MSENKALIEKMARIIDPTSFGATPADYGMRGPDAQERFERTFAYGGQLVAIEKATAALAVVYEALREPDFDPEDVSYSSDMTRLDWWKAMLAASPLSASPIVQEGKAPVNNGDAID